MVKEKAIVDVRDITTRDILEEFKQRNKVVVWAWPGEKQAEQKEMQVRRSERWGRRWGEKRVKEKE